MKKLYKYIVLFIGIVTFCACTDDIEFPNNVVEEGNDVIFNLKFKPEISKEIVNSRTEATGPEKKLYDLHIYVFNANGDLTGYEQINPGTGNIVTPGPQEIRIRAKAGISYIYALANINHGDTYYLDDNTQNLLDVTSGETLYLNSEGKYVPYDDEDENYINVEDFVSSARENGLNHEAFKAINYKRRYATPSENNSPNPSEDEGFIMSGYINDGNPVTITSEGIQLSVGQDDIVRLYRVVAKNTFTIESFSGDGKKGTFTPKYYKLCNVPKTGVLVPNKNISETSLYLKKTLPNGTKTDNITEAEPESYYQWNFEGNKTISFYFPENLQVAKSNTDANPVKPYGQWIWKDRETNRWNKETNTKTFTYAADNAAYIEIYGDYVDNSGNITANVNYTIHFGDFSSTNLDADENRIFTDFNVIRNHEYIYKVTVNGVDDIKVEAQTKTNQDNPYAEGLIVNAEAGTHFLVDAHYEARVMAFTKSSYEDLVDHNMGYFLSISTPFAKTKEPVYVKSYVVDDEGEDLIKYGVFKLGQTTPLIQDVYNITSNELNQIFDIFDNTVGADYTWLKFVRNTETNLINGGTDVSKYTCKYPGDENEKASSYGRWMNIFEFLAELYNEDTYTDNNNTEAYYTCFVDENYYANKTWPEYVDRENRTMLIANKLDVSNDGKSIYAEVEYSFSQRSITTFYTPNYFYPKGETPGDLVIAFGSEIIDEEDKFKSRIHNNSNNTGINTTGVTNKDWDARSIALKSNVGSNNWYSDYITFIARQEDDLKTSADESMDGTQPLYTRAGKACMSRNRDKNGDGHIDGDEVKWYLAAIDQYRALFFGQNSLNVDAYLIDSDSLQWINTYFENNAHWVDEQNNWGRITPAHWEWPSADDENGHYYRARYHYYTSTSGGDKAIFWPEEGLTNNPNNNDWSKAQLVRCIRTLESGGNGLKNPEPYYDYNNNRFDLGGIVATRNYTSGVLAEHNEVRNDANPQQADNNLSASFVMASNDLSYYENNDDGDSYSFQLIDIVSGDDFCKYYTEGGFGPGTWRTPNQKELALMVSKLDDFRYGTRTKFSASQKVYQPTVSENERPQFWHGTSVGHWSDSGGGGRINVGEGYENGVRIRCVRDVNPTPNNGTNTQ